jgi:pimeloyl-ACP methyl ester carboxylesterase
LNSAGQRTVESLNRRPNASKSARLFTIPRAGHQMMIDNPDGFHAAIQQALENHEE